MVGRERGSLLLVLKGHSASRGSRGLPEHDPPPNPITRGSDFQGHRRAVTTLPSSRPSPVSCHSPWQVETRHVPPHSPLPSLGTVRDAGDKEVGLTCLSLTRDARAPGDSPFPGLSWLPEATRISARPPPVLRLPPPRSPSARMRPCDDTVLTSPLPRHRRAPKSLMGSHRSCPLSK